MMNYDDLQKFSFDDVRAFWNRTNRFIKDKKLTQEEVAAIMRTSYGTLRNWSHRKVMPDFREIYYLSQILGTSINYLVWGTEAEPSNQQEFIVGKKLLSLLDALKKQPISG